MIRPFIPRHSNVKCLRLFSLHHPYHLPTSSQYFLNCPIHHLRYLFCFMVAFFCRLMLTLSVDKFRYIALCYHLVIIDLIKNCHSLWSNCSKSPVVFYSSICFTLRHLFRILSGRAHVKGRSSSKHAST